MALGSTIFKARIAIADIDRGYYADHSFALARHPSETDERMMVRLLAFVLHADDRLEFGKGLSSPDEPALAKRDLTGALELWIEVGLPEEKALRKALGRAARVAVLAYGGRAVDIWWAKQGGAMRQMKKLDVWRLDAESTAELATLARPGMELQFTRQDGVVLVSSAARVVELTPERLHGGA